MVLPIQGGRLRLRHKRCLVEDLWIQAALATAGVQSVRSIEHRSALNFLRGPSHTAAQVVG